jgi:hypothetical protein
MSRRARKRARAASAGEVRAPSRSEIKNAEARARLEPLREGERPRAVTVAAVIATGLTIANAIAAFTGHGIASKNVAPGIVYTLLLGSMAWGLWKARYWAVLGLQALLAISMIYTAFALLVAGNALTAVLAIVTLAACGTLFWFLVKAMARIQMPERR